MHSDELQKIAVGTLDELKARDIHVLDVRDKTSITDYMIIASGTSSRHVKSLIDAVSDACLKAGVRPIGVEGTQNAEWALADLGDVIVHVMLPAVRDFYNLDKLWGEQSPSLLNKDGRG